MATLEAAIEPFAAHAHDLSDTCLRFVAIIDGRQWVVEIPIGRVQVIFEQAGRSLGCPLPRRVGGRARTVGGFFSSIKNAYKKATRKIKHALPKVAQHAISKVEHVANQGAHLAMRAHKFAKGIVKSDAFAGAMVGASFLVPALAPATGAVLAARQMIKRIDDGKRAAAALARGASRTPHLMKALARGDAAKRDAKTMVTSAKQGSPIAQQFMGALRQLR